MNHPRSTPQGEVLPDSTQARAHLPSSPATPTPSATETPQEQGRSDDRAECLRVAYALGPNWMDPVAQGRHFLSGIERAGGRITWKDDRFWVAPDPNPMPRLRLFRRSAK